MLTSRSATARWTGSGTDGHGYLSTPSTVLTDSRYSYLTRFADGAGTNPEELIAAAHASCFSMKLAFNLQAAGLTATRIHTSCQLSIENGTIAGSHLQVEMTVEGLQSVDFDALVLDAQQNCPVSKMLAVPITITATLLHEADE